MKPTQEQVIAWAREAGLWPAVTDTFPSEAERFAALAYEAGRESTKLDSIHTCHADCQKPACVAVREAYEAGRKDENEAIAQMIEDAPPLVDFAKNEHGGCVICGFTPKLAAFTIRERNAP